MSVSLKEKVADAVRNNPNKFLTVSEIAKDVGSKKEEVSARLLELCKKGEIARRPVTEEEKTNFKGHGARPQWFYFAGDESDRLVWKTKSKTKNKSKKKALLKKRGAETLPKLNYKKSKVFSSDGVTLKFGEYTFTPTQARNLYTDLQQIFN